eukprot:SAG11_NODE_3154_length_2644_cov_3.422004_5_plen_104_part_00
MGVQRCPPARARRGERHVVNRLDGSRCFDCTAGHPLPLLYRGAAHSKCNLKEGKKNTKQYKIPVFFHNLKNYDGLYLYCFSHLQSSLKENWLKEDLEIDAISL